MKSNTQAWIDAGVHRWRSEVWTQWPPPALLNGHNVEAAFRAGVRWAAENVKELVKHADEISS